MRLTPAHKELIELAAAARGVTVSAFVVGTLVAEAEAAMHAPGTFRVSASNAQRLLRLLENPPAPNAAMRRAMARYANAQRKRA